MKAIPGFNAEASLLPGTGRYRQSAGAENGVAGVVVPQQFPTCNTNRSCWGVVLMCRDHCTRWDGSNFSSLWYVCGGCIGIFQEFLEFQF